MCVSDAGFPLHPYRSWMDKSGGKKVVMWRLLCTKEKEVREDMKMNEILFFLVFPMVLQTANAAIMQFDICPATNGVADCRKFYRSCIRIVSSKPPREIFVPKCGQQIIPLGMKMLISHNGKRCYGKCFCLKGIYYRIYLFHIYM